MGHKRPKSFCSRVPQLSLCVPSRVGQGTKYLPVTPSSDAVSQKIIKRHLQLNMENNSPAGPSGNPSRTPLSDRQNLFDVNQPAIKKPPASARELERQKKLVEKLKELGEEPDNAKVCDEWVFIGITKSSSHTGACLCGSTKPVYLLKMKNKKNGKVAQLGSNCLKLTTGNLRSVLLTAESMCVDSSARIGTLIAQQGDELLFKISKIASIVIYRTELIKMYPGGIPLLRDFTLIAKAGCDEARQMTTGKKYKIWVKLYADYDGASNLTLKAEVANAQLMKEND